MKPSHYDVPVSYAKVLSAKALQALQNEDVRKSEGKSAPCHLLARNKKCVPSSLKVLWDSFPEKQQEMLWKKAADILRRV